MDVKSQGHDDVSGGGENSQSDIPLNYCLVMIFKVKVQFLVTSATV